MQCLDFYCTIQFLFFSTKCMCAVSYTHLDVYKRQAINKIDFRGHIFKRTRQLGAYAGDIVLVARNKNVLKNTVVDLRQLGEHMRMILCW